VLSEATFIESRTFLPVVLNNF